MGTSIRAQDLAYEFQREGFNPATDSCAAWKEGRMVGWVNAFVPHELDQEGWARGVLHGGVHAHARRTRLDESTVVLDRAGHPIAYVLATQWAERQLHLNWIGTVPEHRGRGLALLALDNAIHKSHLSRAYDLITLTVDSANSTGAQRLYEHAGFSRAQQTVVMSKVVTDDSLAEQIAPAT